MTFTAPSRSTGDVAGLFTPFRKVAKARDTRRIVDEDGARAAMGNDISVPVVSLSGASLEHLARIALG